MLLIFPLSALQNYSCLLYTSCFNFYEEKSRILEFGWDGAAGAYVLIDPIHKLSIFYVQHIFGFPKVYSEIHPTIRNLVYETFLHKN